MKIEGAEDNDVSWTLGVARTSSNRTITIIDERVSRKAKIHRLCLLTDGACEVGMLAAADALCRRYLATADDDEKRMAEQRGGPPRG